MLAFILGVLCAPLIFALLVFVFFNVTLIYLKTELHYQRQLCLKAKRRYQSQLCGFREFNVRIAERLLRLPRLFLFGEL